MTQLGSTDFDVLPIALGGNVFGWTADRETSFQILDDFLQSGGSLIDTADAYSAWVDGNTGGESETIIGEWLADRGVRDQVVIATKVGGSPSRSGLRAANISAAVEESLQRLHTDRIDLYWAHQQDPGTPLEETVVAFGELVDRGVVRYVGISNHDADRITEWCEIARRLGTAAPVALQPKYSLLEREPFESQLRPVAEANGLAVLPYFALASGFLTGKYASAEDASDVARSRLVQKYLTDGGFAVADAVREVAAGHGSTPAAVAIAWLLAQPTIAAPIASASKPSQLQPLIDGATLELTDEELAQLDEVSAAFEPA